MKELDKLEAAAKKAQEAADAKNRELQAIWDEFNAIPEKIEAANRRLEQLQAELANLDESKMQAEFKGLYRNVLSGAMASAGFMNALTVRMSTANIRKEALTELINEVSSETAKLEARRKALGKKLNQAV